MLKKKQTFAKSPSKIRATKTSNIVERNLSLLKQQSQKLQTFKANGSDSQSSPGIGVIRSHLSSNNIAIASQSPSKFMRGVTMLNIKKDGSQKMFDIGSKERARERKFSHLIIQQSPSKTYDEKTINMRSSKDCNVVISEISNSSGSASPAKDFENKSNKSNPNLNTFGS